MRGVLRSFLLFAILVAISKSSRPLDLLAQRVVQEEWNTWKVKFGKVYETEAEENMRMLAFMKNKHDIEEHNARYYRGEETYKMTIDNQFGDLVRGYNLQQISLNFQPRAMK